MRIKKGFVLREVCGENIIVGEGLGAVNFGKMLALNETAAWLWTKAMDLSEFTTDDLVDQLCDEYEARPDVTAILDEWLKVGVIE